MAQIPDQTSADVDRQLQDWLELHVGSTQTNPRPVAAPTVHGPGDTSRAHSLLPSAALGIRSERRPHKGR
jgi:hypothetical protein